MIFEELEFQAGLIFLLCFSTFYFVIWYWKRKYETFAKLSPEIQAGAAIRFVSLIHGTLTSILPIYILLTDNELWNNKISYGTPLISFTLTLTISYLSFDLYYMYMWKNDSSIDYYIHHVGSISAFIACVKYKCFPFIALFRLTSELSTFPVHLKWALSKVFKMKESYIYYLSSWAVIVIFFLCRVAPIIPNWIIFYNIINLPLWNETYIGFKIICIFATIPLDCLNLYWFDKLITSLRGYLKERSEKVKSDQKPEKLETNLNALKQKLNEKKVYIGEQFSKLKMIQLLNRSEKQEKLI